MTASTPTNAVTSQTKKATMSAWIGSVLEYYDFFIYATAAALVFPQIFFPSTNPTIAVIASLATYGVGYIARPIGAVVLGHLGDRYGRKNVLVMCLFLMGLSTVAVGLLPTYAQIGIAAPALLVLFRLIQGFAVAGEISGSSSMVLESSPEGRRGFFASFTLQGVQAGQVLAAAIFIPLNYFLSDDAFMSWGWRIPFLLSIIVIVIGFIIRREVEETEIFKNQNQHKNTPSPLAYALKHHSVDMLKIMVMSLMNVVPVVTVVFGAAYATQEAYGIGIPKNVYLWIPAVGNLVAVALIPFVGNLSDIWGRRPVIIIGSILSGLLAYPYLLAISHANIPLAFTISILMWGIIYQGYNAIYPSFYPEMFPATSRVTGMAIAQNVGTAISAMLPALFTLIASSQSTVNHVPELVGGITLFITILVGITAWSCKETSRIKLSELGNPKATPITKEEYLHLRQLSKNTKG